MMKFFLYMLAICTAISASTYTTYAYTLKKEKVAGYATQVFTIPADDEYVLTVAATNEGESLKTLVKSVHGVAGMNGGYFDPIDYNKIRNFSHAIRIVGGDGTVFSKYFPDSGVDGIFGITKDGNPILVQNNIYGEKSLRDNYNSGAIYTIENGIASFPILIYSGKNLLPRYDDAGLITAKMKSKNAKSFICRTADNTVKMGMIEKISIMSVPKVIQKMGCIDAINLDNGGSSAMYNGGRYVRGPGRQIMDAYVLVKKI